MLGLARFPPSPLRILYTMFFKATFVINVSCQIPQKKLKDATTDKNNQSLFVGSKVIPPLIKREKVREEAQKRQVPHEALRCNETR